jgi:hypothetical protein
MPSFSFLIKIKNLTRECKKRREHSHLFFVICTWRKNTFIFELAVGCTWSLASAFFLHLYSEGKRKKNVMHHCITSLFFSLHTQDYYFT